MILRKGYFVLLYYVSPTFSPSSAHRSLFHLPTRIFFTNHIFPFTSFSCHPVDKACLNASKFNPSPGLSLYVVYVFPRLSEFQLNCPHSGTRFSDSHLYFYVFLMLHSDFFKTPSGPVCPYNYFCTNIIHFKCHKMQE